MGSMDITKCSSKDCRFSEQCWRKTTKSDYFQSYMDFTDSCVVYRPDWSKEVINPVWDGESKIVRKVTVNTDGFSMSFIEDYTQMAKDLIQYGDMPVEDILEFFGTGIYTDINNSDKSFIYGFLESKSQSETYQDIFANIDDIKSITVEEVR